jgi:hypothetical protein
MDVVVVVIWGRAWPALQDVCSLAALRLPQCIIKRSFLRERAVALVIVKHFSDEKWRKSWGPLGSSGIEGRIMIMRAVATALSWPNLDASWRV